MNSASTSIPNTPLSSAQSQAPLQVSTASVASTLGVHAPVVVEVTAGTPAASSNHAMQNAMHGTMQSATQGTMPAVTGRHRRWHFICLSAVVLAAAWALWPLPAPSVPDVASTDEHDAEPATKSSVPALFDLAAFHTPLWMTPPAPPTQAAALPPAPPPAPVRLQLLAIIKEADGYAAMCYDPDTDKVRTYREGDSTTENGLGRKVEKITATSVQFRDASQGGGATTLALKSSPVIGGSK